MWGNPDRPRNFSGSWECPENDISIWTTTIQQNEMLIRQMAGFHLIADATNEVRRALTCMQEIYRTSDELHDCARRLYFIVSRLRSDALRSEQLRRSLNSVARPEGVKSRFEDTFVRFEASALSLAGVVSEKIKILIEAGQKAQTRLTSAEITERFKAGFDRATCELFLTDAEDQTKSVFAQGMMQGQLGDLIGLSESINALRTSRTRVLLLSQLCKTPEAESSAIIAKLDKANETLRTYFADGKAGLRLRRTCQMPSVSRWPQLSESCRLRSITEELQHVIHAALTGKYSEEIVAPPIKGDMRLLYTGTLIFSQRSVIDFGDEPIVITTGPHRQPPATDTDGNCYGAGCGPVSDSQTPPSSADAREIINGDFDRGPDREIPRIGSRGGNSNGNDEGPRASAGSDSESRQARNSGELGDFERQLEAWLDRYSANGAPRVVPLLGPNYPTINRFYVVEVDKYIERKNDLLATMQGNFVYAMGSQINNMPESTEVTCSRCVSSNDTDTFNERVNKQIGLASVPFKITSPYSPDPSPSVHLLNHRFMIPHGPARAELLATYSKLKAATPISPQGRTAQVIGLRASVLADEAGTSGDKDGFDTSLEVAKAMLDLTVSFSPAGIAKDAYEAITGRSLIDGRPLGDAERTMAAFGVLFAGSVSKARALESVSKVISKLASRMRLREAAIEGLLAVSRAGVRAGEKTKAEFRRLFEISRRVSGGEIEPISRKLLDGGKEAEAQMGRILRAFGGLPEHLLNPRAIRIGSNEKVALIGREMSAVTEVESHLANNGIAAEIFDRSLSIDVRNAFESFELTKARVGRYLTEAEVIGTDLFRENVKWAQKLRDSGYTVIDVGNPYGKQPSVFYSMERNILFNKE